MTAVLSDPDRTLRLMQVNPWQRLAEDWPGVPVTYAPLQASSRTMYRHAETRWKRGQPVAVTLHERLTQVQRRCALAHELEHLDRGAPCETLRATIERRVVAATARYLLPDIELVAEAVQVYDLRRAADELWVTFPILVDRLRGLTTVELDMVLIGRESVA